MNDTYVAIFCAIIGSGCLSTITSALITHFTNKRKIHQDIDNNISEGLMVLLEDRINYLVFKYLGNGWVYLDDKDRVKRMWSIYHNKLKGNGYLDDAIKMLDKLPIKLRGDK